MRPQPVSPGRLYRGVLYDYAAIAPQARLAFTAGSGPEQVLKTTVFVVAGNRPDLVRVWNVITHGFGGSRPPSTLLGVAMLGYPDQLVEIEAVALYAEDAGTPDSGSVGSL